MTIECYYSQCPHHGNNETPKEEGPFCYQAECLATEVQLLEFMKAEGPPFRCLFCGAPSWVDPSDQYPPPDYCHESDHGEPD